MPWQGRSLVKQLNVNLIRSTIGQGDNFLEGNFLGEYINILVLITEWWPRTSVHYYVNPRNIVFKICVSQYENEFVSIAMEI